MDVNMTLGDSRSKRFRDKRGAHFVMEDDDERQQTTDGGHGIRQKCHPAFCQITTNY